MRYKIYRIGRSGVHILVASIVYKDQAFKLFESLDDVYMTDNDKLVAEKMKGQVHIHER